MVVPGEVWVCEVGLGGVLDYDGSGGFGQSSAKTNKPWSLSSALATERLDQMRKHHNTNNQHHHAAFAKTNTALFGAGEGGLCAVPKTLRRPCPSGRSIHSAPCMLRLWFAP